MRFPTRTGGARRDPGGRREVSRMLLRAATPALALGFMLAPPATAGVQGVDCRNPFVFSSAAVNVVVLPHYSATSTEPLSVAARRLSLLIQLDALFSIARLGSVGAVQLVVGPNDREECAAEVVLAKLLGERPGASEVVQPGHGLVLVWGRLYEEGDAIYIQTFVHFERRGMHEDLELKQRDTSFRVSLSASSFAFARARLTASDLDQIAEQFRSTTRVFGDPDERATSVPMPVLDRSFAYWISDLQGDWMRIDPAGPGPRGWIRAGGAGRLFPLRTRLPELHFVEGAAGYLSHRWQTSQIGRRRNPRAKEWAEEAVRRFLESAPAGTPALAQAVPRQVLAFLRLDDPNRTPEDMRVAAEMAAQAAAKIPYSGAALGLDSVCQIYLAWGSDSRTLPARSIAEQLSRAVALSPASAQPVRNLEGFYQILLVSPQMRMTPQETLEPAEVKLRLSEIKTVQMKQGMRVHRPETRP